MDKNKKLALTGAIGGAISSALGILGAVCTPVCGTVCVGGILAAITGIGLVTFLYKYHIFFLFTGICFFIGGVILFIRGKKNVCSHDQS